MDKFIGKRLDGRYEFSELIGIGGMANVYKARDIVENRDVAIKILKDEYLGNEEFVRRFRNESKAVASLSHPNIVRIFDVNFGDRIQYIVMEYIDGITLKEYIEKAHALNWKDTVHFTVQILRALQHAHDKGIVHRDVKPQNMMLLQDGTIKVMDFGIARFARDETRNQDKAIGSVHYISPEQASGSVTDAKSDIYSVGVMMYEMLTGRLPFDGDSPEEVAVKQMQQVPVNPRQINPEIPEGLEEIIIRAMQKNPSKRYQSAAEMLRDIDEFKKNPSILFEYKYFTDEGTTRYFDAQPAPAEKAGAVVPAQKQALGKNGKPKKSKTIPILLGVAGGVLLVAIIVIVIFVVNNGNRDVVDIETPNFVGMQLEDAKKQYPDLGFVVTEKDSDKPAGEIIDQSPKAGSTTIKSDYKNMQVTVSKGTAKGTVPTVANLSLAEAKTKLSNAGFKNIKTVEQDNADITAGYVISTDPKEGSQVAQSTTITIYYSNGKGKQTDIPNVVGQSLNNAKQTLTAAGFNVEVQTRDDKAAKDTVLEVSPSGQAATGSTITIVVSSGKVPSKSANISIPLHSNASVSGSFNVSVTNSATGQTVAGGTYSVGQSVEFTDTGSGSVTYTVSISNVDTGLSASYGSVTVNYDADTPAISSNLDSGAFAQTVKTSQSSTSSQANEEE